MDRRNYERFEVELPTRMETIISKKKQVFDLLTKNISASGAFVSTTSPFADGMCIKISLTTQNKRIGELTGSQSLIECEGRIIRTTPVGFAICFNKDCKVMSCKGFVPGN